MRQSGEMVMTRKKHTTKGEQGIASIMITMIMLAVITLIVIGFTQVANRNRRQALDRQLSTQAFYAAESGVNQVANYIASNPGSASSASSTCTSNNYGISVPSKLDANGNVAITCVLVSPQSPTVDTTGDINVPSVVELNPVDKTGNNTTAASLTFHWTSSDPVSYTGCSQPLGTFAAQYTNCSYGLLRMDLFQYKTNYQYGNSAPPAAAEMANNTISVYFQPEQSATNVNVGNFSGSPRAYIGGATCNSAECNATINFTGNGQPQQYLARMIMFYNTAPSIKVSGIATNGQPLNFSGQYTIDVTARAQDILRRVVARYTPSMQSTAPQPVSAIQAGGDVCKQLAIIPPSTITDSCP